MKMNNVIGPIAFGLVAAGIVALAMDTSIKTDNCTPRLITKYTNEIISFQECLAGERCIYEPSDIRKFHTAQLNFRQCVIEIAGKKENEANE